ICLWYSVNSGYACIPILFAFVFTALLDLFTSSAILSKSEAVLISFNNSVCSFVQLYTISFFTKIQKNPKQSKLKRYTDKGFNIFHVILHYINRLKQVKLTFLVNQIRFTFDVREVIGIVANERHFEPSANRPDRNFITFVRKNTTVIGNAAKWFKSAFNFSVQFVSISDLRNTSYQHLCGKIRRTFQGVIDFVVNFKLVKHLLFPRYFRNGITNCIRFFNGLKKQISLFFGRQKFNLQCKFHNTNLLQIFEITKSEQQVAFLQPTQAMGWFPAPIL